MSSHQAVDKIVQTEFLRGRLRRHVPLARYTSWRVGGPADFFYEPADLDDLCTLLRQLPKDEPILFIGLGSNLLVRDGGVRGTVIHLHGLLNELIPAEPEDTPEFKLPADEALLYVESGVASPKLARYAAGQGLEGAGFLAGIPGTVGGALAMNAGCHGSETWEHVAQVLTVDRAGHLHTRGRGEFNVGYRSVQPVPPRDEWFIAAWMHFKRGDDARARADMKAMLERRSATQPLHLPNAGSVFRNPDGNHAARLIESCGLKGLRIGDAQVSEKHANFIVNLGHAKASDIEALIAKVQAEVQQQTGIALQREVHIVGTTT
jgi:UDP-N-acetylmuramate dehydrogenase